MHVLQAVFDFLERGFIQIQQFGTQVARGGA